MESSHQPVLFLQPELNQGRCSHPVADTYLWWKQPKKTAVSWWRLISVAVVFPFVLKLKPNFPFYWHVCHNLSKQLKSCDLLALCTGCLCMKKKDNVDWDVLGLLWIDYILKNLCSCFMFFYPSSPSRFSEVNSQHSRAHLRTPSPARSWSPWPTPDQELSFKTDVVCRDKLYLNDSDYIPHPKSQFL